MIMFRAVSFGCYQEEYYNNNNNYYTSLIASFPGQPGEAVPER